MIDAPEIVQTATRPTAVIRITVARSEIRHVMGPAIGEVIATLASQGVAPAGPVFALHHRIDPEVFDFEVGVPVGGAFAPAGRLVASALPARRAARTVHHGPYEGLAEAWGDFKRWIHAQGLATAAGVWEVYAAGPERSPDPTTWRTELYQPLAG